MPTALRQKDALSHKGRSVFQVSNLSGRQNKSPSTPEMGQFNFIDLLDWVCLTMVYTLQNGQIDRETGDKSMIKHQIGSDKYSLWPGRACFHTCHGQKLDPANWTSFFSPSALVTNTRHLRFGLVWIMESDPQTPCEKLHCTPILLGSSIHRI